MLTLYNIQKCFLNGPPPKKKIPSKWEGARTSHLNAVHYRWSQVLKFKEKAKLPTCTPHVIINYLMQNAWEKNTLSMDYVSSSIRNKFTVTSKAAFNGVLWGNCISPDTPHHPT